MALSMFSNVACEICRWERYFLTTTSAVLSVLQLVVFIAAVTVGDRHKERGQLLGPNSCLPLLLATLAL